MLELADVSFLLVRVVTVIARRLDLLNQHLALRASFIRDEPCSNRLKNWLVRLVQ